MYSWNKIESFLKIRMSYATDEVVPWYKGYWYYNPESNKYICIIIPLNLILILIREFYYKIQIFGMDTERFHRLQIKLRKDRKNKIVD